MTGLSMPKGKSAAAMLQELNAEHAVPAEPITREEDTQEATFTPARQLMPPAVPQRKPPVITPPMEETISIPNLESGGAQNVTAEQFAATDAPSITSKVRAKIPSQTSRTASTERDVRFERAVAQAEDDDISIVTVRVSTKLNEYMDRYVERINRINPKRKYRKQDAVCEAFAAFFADHAMPPAPVETDL